MKKILFFGECLIRITPDRFSFVGDKIKSTIYFGGSELNVARNLSGFGVKTDFFTGLPDNDIGLKFKNFMEENRIGANLVENCGSRVGIYYLEEGIGERASEVFYDRSNTSINDIEIKNLEYDKIFEDVEIFHFSGITVGISEKVRNILKELLSEAKKRNIKVSMDLNFRKKMLSILEAKKFFSEIARDVDICFGIEPIKASDDDLNMFKRNSATDSDIKDRMEVLKNKYSFKNIFHTVRIKDEYGKNIYYAYEMSDTGFKKSRDFICENMGRIGSGDAFVSGVLYKIITGKEEEALDFGVASGSYKCTIEGDSMFVGANKIEKIINIGTSLER